MIEPTEGWESYLELINSKVIQAQDAADRAKSEAIASASADATTKANQAETNAKAEVTALANGAVKTNTDAIADNAQAIADIQSAMPTPITNAKIDELFATV